MAEEMRDVRKQFERHTTVQLERVVAVVVIVALLLVDRHRFGGEKAHRARLRPQAHLEPVRARVPALTAARVTRSVHAASASSARSVSLANAHRRIDEEPAVGAAGERPVDKVDRGLAPRGRNHEIAPGSATKTLSWECGARATRER